MIKPRLVVSEEKNLKGRRIAGRVYNTKIRYSDKLSRKSAFIGFLKKKTKGYLRTRPFKQKRPTGLSRMCRIYVKAPARS